ncbi:MAG: hypothetical protein ACR2MO_04595 [Acidimicrobiales bacterium]
MARTQPKGSPRSARPAAGRGRPARGRPPARGRLYRNALWLSLAAVVVAVAVVVMASGGGDSHQPAAATSSSKGLVGGDFHSLVVDPVTPTRLFVGGHEVVSTSSDGGRTWSRVASLDGADAMGWSFTANAVYVSGHPGIRRSTDGAASFSPANAGLPDTDVHAFGAGRSTLYAAGPSNGVIASTDGGRTWQTRTNDAGQAFFGRILAGPDDDQHLIAADARAGAAESTDGGRTWHGLGGPPSALWVSRAGTNLYVSGPEGAGRSADGGKTWQKFVLPKGASLVEADPTDLNLLYAGIHDGNAVQVMVSRDGGARWQRP